MLLIFFQKLKLKLLLMMIFRMKQLTCIENSAKTGRIGDGKIFVTNIEQSIKNKNW